MPSPDSTPTPPARDRRPEELDELAAQLNQLGATTPVPGGRPIVEDDDSDDDLPAHPDGTLCASEPARPLWVCEEVA